MSHQQGDHHNRIFAALGFVNSGGVSFLLSSFYYFQDSINFMLNKWPLFALQEYGGFKTFKAMPNILRYVNAIGSTILTDDTGLQDLAVIIVGRDSDFTFQDYKSLGLGRMMMHGYECAWLQTIEETVAFLIQTLMEIVVHPQPW